MQAPPTALLLSLPPAEILRQGNKPVASAFACEQQFNPASFRQWLVERPGASKRLMTGLHFLNDYTEDQQDA